MRAKSIGRVVPCTISLLRNMRMNGCQWNACGNACGIACGNACGNACGIACGNACGIACGITRNRFRSSCALTEGCIWLSMMLFTRPIWISLLSRMALRRARSTPFHRFPAILVNSSFKTSMYAFNRSNNRGRKFWVPDVLPQRVHQLNLLKNGTHSTSVVINCLSL